MIAGRLANMKSGSRTDVEPNALMREVSIKQAAQQLSVGTRSVNNAKLMLESGDDELIHQVETGDMSVTTAAKRVREHNKQVDDLVPKKRRKCTREPAEVSAARAATQR